MLIRVFIQLKAPFMAFIAFHYNEKVSLRHKRCTSDPCTFNSTTWCSHVKERFRMQKRHFPCIRPLIEVSDYSGIDKLEGNDANFNRRGKKKHEILTLLSDYFITVK